MMLVSSGGGGFWQLIVVLFIFAAILGVTYWVTRWVAGYQKQMVTGRNLEIVETVRISPNKYIQIVRAGKDKYFVLAIGKDEVNKIGELSAEEVESFTDNQPVSGMPDFKSMLSKLSKIEKKN